MCPLTFFACLQCKFAHAMLNLKMALFYSLIALLFLIFGLSLLADWFYFFYPASDCFFFKLRQARLSATDSSQLDVDIRCNIFFNEINNNYHVKIKLKSVAAHSSVVS